MSPGIPALALPAGQVGREVNRVEALSAAGTNRLADVVRFFSEVDLMKRFAREQIEAIAKCVVWQNFDDGALLMEQGETGDCMLVLHSGKARAEINGTVVRSYARGDYFGELALLEEQPRAASVRAIGAVCCCRLDKTGFLRVVEGIDGGGQTPLIDSDAIDDAPLASVATAQLSPKRREGSPKSPKIRTSIPAASKASQASDQAKKWFAELDVDGSGSLDITEFEQLFRKLGLPIKRNGRQSLSRSFAEMDTNGSGEVYFSQFDSWWTRFKEQRRRKVCAQVRELFERFDTRGDGELQKAEIGRLVLSSKSLAGGRRGGGDDFVYAHGRRVGGANRRRYQVGDPAGIPRQRIFLWGNTIAG